MQQHRQIIVATDLSNIPSRDFLSGVLQYAHDKQDWRIRVLQSPKELTEHVVREIGSTPGCGLITTESPSRGISDILASSSFPLLLVGTHDHILPDRTKNIVRLSIDEASVGRQATDHLLSFGRFRSCAFVPFRQASGLMLSTIREHAFSRRCVRSGAQVCSFRDLRDEDFADRLATLPRPVACLAETAERGQFILQTADRIGLEIPRQCVLVVLESDSLVCSATAPKLSNLYPDATGVGIEAARRMDLLLKRKTPCSCKTACISGPLVIRDHETTASVAPAAALVQRATELIERQAEKFATAEDLAQSLGVSRRLLDLRFSGSTGRTASKALREAKLANFAHRLLETNLPIDRLAESCGFPNASYLKTLFRKTYGQTPGNYRRQAAITR